VPFTICAHQTDLGSKNSQSSVDQAEGWLCKGDQSRLQMLFILI